MDVYDLKPVWYSFTSGFTSSFTTSIAKWPTLCPTLWPASLKTLSHRVKYMVKLQKHSSPLLMKLLMKLFSKKQLYWWSWAVPNRALLATKRWNKFLHLLCFVGAQEVLDSGFLLILVTSIWYLTDRWVPPQSLTCGSGWHISNLAES
jgi:hypothetical protein